MILIPLLNHWIVLVIVVRAIDLFLLFNCIEHCPWLIDWNLVKTAIDAIISIFPVPISCIIRVNIVWIMMTTLLPDNIL